MTKHFLLSLCISLLWSCSEAPEKVTQKVEPTAITETTPTPETTDQPPAFIQDAIEFPSGDDLPMFAKLTLVNQPNPVIVLCHQAGSSKDEYKDIAKKLAEMGFSSMAIDQRSGGDKLGGFNETAQLAKQEKKAMEFLDAEQDIVAAVNYMATNSGKPVILVGSSYSAALALKIGSESTKVQGVVAFSPGEYFNDKGKTFIQDVLANKNFNKPLFVTSSKAEAPQAKVFYDKAKSNPANKVHFIPTKEGVHGAKALWKDTEGSEEYWKALGEFLEKFKTKKPSV